MKIGVYIGSFNPVHKTHVLLVKSILNELDKIILIPAGDNYYLKNNLIDYSYRYEMLKIAFKNIDKVVISNFEKEKYCYTYENIKLLKKEYPNDDLYLILGADNLSEFNTWDNYEYILKNCNFIVFGRNDIDISNCINNNFTKYKNKFIIKESLNDFSSTLIRKLLKDNKDCTKYLDEKVLKFIIDNNLYRE